MEQEAAPQPPLAKAREEPGDMGPEAALLAAFAAAPSVSRGWCFPAPDGVRLSLQMAQRNLPSNSVRKYLQQLPLSEAVLERGAVDAALPLELRDVAALGPSPSGDKTLVVRGGSNDTSAVLEVWGRTGGVLAELHVPKALHGAVYNDGWFGTSLAWSPDETRVVYVAEAPPAAKTPEWGARLGADGKKAEGAGPKGWRGVGEWQEDWGELNTGKKVPALFVLDLTLGEVLPVAGLPEDASCGQPVWTPEGDGLVFVSWPHQASNFPDMAQRLGIVFCFNRPCALHAVPWPQASPAAAPVALTPAVRSAFSPRFSPSGATLAFLSQQAAVDSGVHSATSSLHTLPWKEFGSGALAGAAALPAPRTVVPVVWSAPSADAFPGLYCNVLPEAPFVGEETLVLTSQWRSTTAVLAVDLSSGDVSRATPANGASWSLVAAGSDWLVASESLPSQPYALYACHVTPRERGQPGAWGWSRLPLDPTPDLPAALRDALPRLRAGVLELEAPAPGGGPGVPYEGVVLYQEGGEPGPRPAVITPHGGPHTAYSAQFFAPLAYLASLGYAVVLLNYRGSTGFGEASIQSLPGHIGTNDVADCLATLQAAVDRGFVDPLRVAVVGGSHGGFLTGNLVGQRPELFRCAALRNPVCDLSLMVHVTDIPDWCYVEAWGSKEGLRRAAAKPGAEDTARFLEVSPAAHVGAVSCPMLFLLGAKDRRVPHEDARQYVNALKARGAGGPEVRTLVFPEDTHALDKPQTDYEQWLNVAWWLKRHMPAAP